MPPKQPRSSAATAATSTGKPAKKKPTVTAKALIAPRAPKAPRRPPPTPCPTALCTWKTIAKDRTRAIQKHLPYAMAGQDDDLLYAEHVTAYKERAKKHCKST